MNPRNIAFPHPKYPNFQAQNPEFKALFGLKPTEKWPSEGLGTRKVTTSNGERMSLWVNPLRPTSRQGVPRLIALCPRCSTTFGGGKIQQHYVACCKQTK